MVCTQDIAEAAKQSAINDPDDAHLETLTFNCTDGEEMVDAVLSGTDGTAFDIIQCLAPIHPLSETPPSARRFESL